MRSRLSILAILCVLASLFVPGITSANTASDVEYRARFFDLHEQIHVGGKGSLVSELHPGCKLTYDDLAPGSLLAVSRGVLLDELTQAGIKHSPEDVLRIARDPSGRIVFLESGNARAGLQHIVSRHAEDFARVGVSEAQIPDLVIAATTEGRVVGMQGGRPIYEVAFVGQTRRVAVTVGDNGFIVGANPVGR